MQYILLHEPEFSTVIPVMALISIVSSHVLANANFSVFCVLFLKSRKNFSTYDILGDKKRVILFG